MKTRIIFIILFFTLSLSEKVFAGNDFVKKLIFSIQVNSKNPISDYDVDQNENVYVLRSENPIVEVYDKNGNLKKTFSWDKNSHDQYAFIKADIDGSVLIYPKIIGSSKARIYKENGKKIGEFPAEDDVYLKSDIGFSGGQVFLRKTNKILFKNGSRILGSQGMTTAKKIKKGSGSNSSFVFVPFNDQQIKLSRQIDGYLFDRLLEVDEKGELFCIYSTLPEMIQNTAGTIDRISKYRIYVFDKYSNLVGALKLDSEEDPSTLFLIRNQKLYRFEIEGSAQKLYEWLRD